MLNSCTSSKKENENETSIYETVKSHSSQLEINLPVESSNDYYRDEVYLKLFDSQKNIVKSELDTVTKTGRYITYFGGFPVFVGFPFLKASLFFIQFKNQLFLDYEKKQI